MAHVKQRTWVHGKDGEWSKIQLPSFSDILEALETIKHPLSSPTDAMGTPILWTLDEHERFIQGLRVYPDGPYEWIAHHAQTKCPSDVKSYGIQCWQFVARHQDNKVKIEVPGKRHRVRKWLRATFKWCVEALSFRCLRHQEYAAGGAIARYPVRRSRPVRASDHYNAYAFYGTRAPTRGPPTLRSRAGFVPSTQRERDGENANAPHFDDTRLLESFEYGPSDEDEDDDDWNMRSARRAATEIEWFDTMREPVEPIAKPVRKHGAWSTDEHERYCEGVELFRFGSWKRIADHVGTRTVPQVMSHAQSIRAKRKRTEEREKRRPTPSKACVLGLASPTKGASFRRPRCKSARTSKPTPEELLIASMSGPLPATIENRQFHSVAATKNNDAGVKSIDIPSSNVAFKASSGLLSQPSVGGAHNAKDDETGCQRAVPIEKHQLCPDTILDCEVPLCSPPPDILLSDEDLVELLDITSTQSQVPIATGG